MPDSNSSKGCKITDTALFLLRLIPYAECLADVIASRMASKIFVAPAEMQNSLNISGR